MPPDRHCQASPTSMPRPLTIMCEGVGGGGSVCATAMKYLALVAFFTFVAERTFAFFFAVAVAFAFRLLPGKPEVQGSSQGNQTAGTQCNSLPSFSSVDHQVACTAFLASSSAWLGAEFLRMRCTSWRISTNCK